MQAAVVPGTGRAGSSSARHGDSLQRAAPWIARRAACATVAEVRKRGEDFWAEFEFYLSVSGRRAAGLALARA